MTDVKTISEIRHENLLTLIDEMGSADALAEAAGTTVPTAPLTTGGFFSSVIVSLHPGTMPGERIFAQIKQSA